MIRRNLDIRRGLGVRWTLFLSATDWRRARRRLCVAVVALLLIGLVGGVVALDRRDRYSWPIESAGEAAAYVRSWQAIVCDGRRADVRCDARGDGWICRWRGDQELYVPRHWSESIDGYGC